MISSEPIGHRTATGLNTHAATARTANDAGPGNAVLGLELAGDGPPLPPHPYARTAQYCLLQSTVKIGAFTQLWPGESGCGGAIPRFGLPIGTAEDNRGAESTTADVEVPVAAIASLEYSYTGVSW